MLLNKSLLLSIAYKAVIKEAFMKHSSPIGVLIATAVDLTHIQPVGDNIKLLASFEATRKARVLDINASGKAIT